MNVNKYNHIYQVLSSDISEGNYGRGDVLPSEHTLVSTFDVSRETVRKALNLLQENGYIQKMKGKGSVVIYNPSMDFTVSHLTSFKEIQQLKTKQYTTKVVELVQYPAAEFPKVLEALKLEADDRVWRLIRQRQFEGKTHIVDTDYFIVEMMPGLNTRIAGDSIYEYIEKRLGLTIAYSHKEITFDPMNEKDLELFGNVIPPYTATVRSVVHLTDARPFQYNISKHLANEFKFVDFSRRFQGG
ncbi:trehalose operon repressor [Salinicoccus sp. ID82-1]|uniref:trehalose operon repressor n=1 Tax=Salinicoccus sp. ID82-1 TaxID=2820269 RepID=UPI001F00DB5D|nr:trehalose operon repressor [Salinicoccus sp. ID82-1]MCG1010623.1 trehalose operon repressor [Salinicoccus sp. ID82-1]